MNQLTSKNEFSLQPTNFDEALKFAAIIANSSFSPVQFKGKQHDVLIAIQMGSELGLKPMQALQNISVINGRPSIWGDAMLAVCRQHPDFESIEEESNDTEAKCIVKRKGNPPIVVVFSVDDAKKAGLWGKQGPWTSYPKRMLQMRARGFCLRDAFPDALKGLISAEEAQDYPEKDITPVKNNSTEKKEFFDDELKLTINQRPSHNRQSFEMKYPEIKEKASDKSISVLFDLIEATETSDETVNKWLKKASVQTANDMNQEQVDACIELLTKKLQEKNNQGE